MGTTKGALALVVLVLFQSGCATGVPPERWDVGEPLPPPAPDAFGPPGHEGA
jgi:hypothetical protein